nr:multidrug effflux MFS transporter [Trinickia diaoshuihuensis]
MGCLGALCSIGPISIDMYLPAAATLTVAFGSAPSHIALSIPSYLVGVLIGQLTHGFVSDLYGRKRPLYAGLVIYAGSSFACSCTQTVDWFIALRFLQGIGGSAGMVLARAMVHDRTDLQERARTFSTLMLAASVAPLVAPLVGAGLLEVGGWRAIFWSMGTVGLALLALSVAMPETLPIDRRALTGSDRAPYGWREILYDRQFITWACTSGFLQGGMFAYFAMSARVFVDAYGLSSGLFSATFAANSLGMVIAAHVNGLLVLRLALKRVAKSALWVSLVPVLALLALYERPPTFLLLGSVFVYLSMIGFVAPNSAAIALARHAERAGFASALLGTLLFGIGAASAAIAAHVMPWAPERSLMLAMLGCSALAILCTYMTPR